MGDVDGSVRCFERAGAILRRLRAASEGGEGNAASNSDTKYVLTAPTV